MKAVVAILAALVCLGALFWFYTAPKAPVEMTEAETAQYEAEVTQAITDRLNAYEEVAVNGDLDGMMSYWTPDIRYIETGIDLGGDEWFSYLREFVSSGSETLSFSWEPIEFFVHGDVAYQIARYHESAQVPGEAPTEIHNTYFARWERGPDGVWKMSRVVSGPIDAPTEG